MKEFAMITPRELLDTSIAQLWTLARFLGEQLGEGREGAEPATAEIRACREILRSLSVLIPRLEAAGYGSGREIDLALAIGEAHITPPRTVARKLDATFS
jgi:hypothetical protein